MAPEEEGTNHLPGEAVEECFEPLLPSGKVVRSRLPDGPDATRVAVAFGRVLRGVGLDAPVGSVATFAEALALVGLERRSSVLWAARATLLRSPADRARFDAAFAALFGRLAAEPAQDDADVAPVTLAFDDDDDDDDDGGARAGDPEDDGRSDVLAVRWSREEVLRRKDFAACSAAELDEAHRLMASLRLGGDRRRSRRLRPANRRTRRPDLRRTVRSSLRSGGDPARPAHRRLGTSPRRVVLLVDVSGSMAPYARALLRFLHASVAGRRRTEAFALGTRLTRLTRELATHDPDAALAAATDAVPDWSGGTRLGEGVAEFCATWGVRGMARGATVVVLSDGWDRGDPAVLAEAMGRLRRVAHRIVWVNPLKATPGYAPLAAGMAAALPFVDAFVEGHNLAALEDLARVVATP